MLTVPLKGTTVPLSGESVKVTVGEPYQISCVVTGDEAPTDNPWLHSDKTKVEGDTKAGVKGEREERQGLQVQQAAQGHQHLHEAP